MNTRLIKFRVWDKKKNGFYLPKHLDNLFGGAITNSRARAKPLLNVKSIAFVIFDDLSERYVVQQFTGLKDKNGKEIYEGDILGLNNLDIKGFVEYLPNSLCYTLRHPKSPNYRFDLYLLDDPVEPEEGIITNARTCRINTNRIEILGNIFENKELLES